METPYFCPAENTPGRPKRVRGRATLRDPDRSAARTVCAVSRALVGMCRVKLACRDGQEVLAERLRYEQAKGRGAPRAGQERIDCGVRTKRGGGLIRSSLGATMAVVGGLHLRSARSDEGPSGRGRAGGGSDAAESLGWAAQWRPRCTVHEVQARAPLWTLSWETV